MAQQLVVPVVTIDGKEYVALAEHKLVIADLRCDFVYQIGDLKRDLDRAQKAFDRDRQLFIEEESRMRDLLSQARRSADFDAALLRNIEAQTAAQERIAASFGKSQENAPLK